MADALDPAELENRRATLRVITVDLDELKADVAECTAMHELIADQGAVDPQTRRPFTDKRRAEVFEAWREEYDRLVFRRPNVPPDDDDDDDDDPA